MTSEFPWPRFLYTKVTNLQLYAYSVVTGWVSKQDWVLMPVLFRVTGTWTVLKPAQAYVQMEKGGRDRVGVKEEARSLYGY
jgi:hypothetical protein